MNRAQSWSHYFNTNDVEPLVKSYWHSINKMAKEMYCDDAEDMFQWGMIGLLKAINMIDPVRMKSADAWVWLNVRGMMFNYHKPRFKYVSFEQSPGDDLTYAEILGEEDTSAMQIDVKNVLQSASDLDEAKQILENGGYSPMVRKNETETEKQVARFRAGLISLRGLARELGISRRQAYTLIGGLPATW